MPELETQPIDISSSDAISLTFWQDLSINPLFLELLSGKGLGNLIRSFAWYYYIQILNQQYLPYWDESSKNALSFSEGKAAVPGTSWWHSNTANKWTSTGLKWRNKLFWCQQNLKSELDFNFSSKNLAEMLIKLRILILFHSIKENILLFLRTAPIC